jgi:zinc transporter, ZIP family
MTERMVNKFRLWFTFLAPLGILIALMWVFVTYGPLGVLKGDFPPIEEVFIDRVIFETEEITLSVFNDGPEPVQISQLVVNEAIWQFDMDPETQVLEPLESGKVYISYPWIEGDPIAFTLIASDGVTFDKEVDVSFYTPVVDAAYVKTFVLLGVYVGVIPVLLGLLWFPFLRRLRGSAYMFLLSLTVGLLLFLGFDTLAESIELIDQIPETLNGVGLIVIGFLLAILILGAVTYKTEQNIKERSDQHKALSWGYLIALGIGLHNLGEGLAIGSAYAIGEIALGGALVIGFMAHNLTEGVAIIAPLTKGKAKIRSIILHLFMMGILAGAPTIIGSLLGGFAYSPAMALFFLAIGAGAIFDVCFDIIHHMAKGRMNSLFTITNVLGFLAGLVVMYGTGFLVVA